jgi:hypothetical protein
MSPGECGHRRTAFAAHLRPNTWLPTLAADGGRSRGSGNRDDPRRSGNERSIAGVEGPQQSPLEPQQSPLDILSLGTAPGGPYEQLRGFVRARLHSRSAALGGLRERGAFGHPASIGPDGTSGRKWVCVVRSASYRVDRRLRREHGCPDDCFAVGWHSEPTANPLI